jgi:flagellar hook-associated protein 1 FlgK
MGLFDTLDIGYSGMSVNQKAMNTVGHNIANANNSSYTRQRVIIEPHEPLHILPGDVGRGAKVAVIERVHDEFVYKRLKSSSTELEYHSYSQTTLEEVAQYFPDLDGVGLSRDMENYFGAWNDLAANPSDTSLKVNLSQMSQTLATNTQNSRDKLSSMQDSINEQLVSEINQINEIGEHVALINADIARVESVEGNRANDLRDKRDELEMTLAKLLDFNVFKGDMTGNSRSDTSMTDVGQKYHLNIAGQSFIDGSSYHPLEITNQTNGSKYYSIYYKTQDNIRVDLSGHINGGKVGAMLDLRGGRIDETTLEPEDGLIQGYKEDLDTFANTLIVNTNTLYASSAQTIMQSDAMKDYKDDTPVLIGDNNIQEGSFDAVVYNANGEEIARRTINIDIGTVFDSNDGPVYNGNSIVSQFNKPNSDDNGDNDKTNDVDDYFNAIFMNSDDGGILTLQEDPDYAGLGYTVAIEDNGTNFSGTTGLSKFFDGVDGTDIRLKTSLISDPASIQAFTAPVDGNNELANDMVQLQYDQISFYRKNGTEFDDTLNGFYRFITSEIAGDGESANHAKDTSQALYNTVYEEDQSISGVSIDEELAALIKYQTGYGASAKVIQTIDRMLDTLLGIKS